MKNLSIVVDTNIFVSALLNKQGRCREIIQQCLRKEYVCLMGDALYLEYLSLLRRKDLFKNCVVSQQDREDLMDAFMSICKWTKVYFRWRPNLPDEGDNHIIELALAGNAEMIVTDNVKDFKNQQLFFPELIICSAKQFLEMRK